MDVLSRRDRSLLMSSVGTKNTKPELAVRRLLTELGFHYRLHASSLPGRPDIVNRRLKRAIFVHGCFWHSHSCRKGSRPKSNIHFWNKKLDNNVARDRAALRTLTRHGWKVLVVWECQIKELPQLQRKIRSWLSRP